MKLAATEAIHEDTGDPAPWQAAALINEKDHKVEWSVGIPGAMPQLAQGKKTGAVEGVNTVNEELHEKYDAKYGKDMNHYVPVTTLFRVFGLMVAPGSPSPLEPFTMNPAAQTWLVRAWTSSSSRVRTSLFTGEPSMAWAALPR